MSKIKNGGLHQYGTEPFEQQQFGAAGVEEVNLVSSPSGVQDRAPAENILVLPACDRTPLAANFIHFQWNQIYRVGCYRLRAATKSAEQYCWKSRGTCCGVP